MVFSLKFQKFLWKLATLTTPMAQKGNLKRSQSQCSLNGAFYECICIIIPNLVLKDVPNNKKWHFQISTWYVFAIMFQHFCSYENSNSHMITCHIICSYGLKMLKPPNHFILCMLKGLLGFFFYTWVIPFEPSLFFLLRPWVWTSIELNLLFFFLLLGSFVFCSFVLKVVYHFVLVLALKTYLTFVYQTKQTLTRIML